MTDQKKLHVWKIDVLGHGGSELVIAYDVGDAISIIQKEGMSGDVEQEAKDEATALNENEPVRLFWNVEDVDCSTPENKKEVLEWDTEMTPGYGAPEDDENEWSDYGPSQIRTAGAWIRFLGRGYLATERMEGGGCGGSPSSVGVFDKVFWKESREAKKVKKSA